MKFYMFQNERYKTKGIDKYVSHDTQMKMWEMIESIKVENRDYLQVFRLSVYWNKNGKLFQKIVHTQERPSYEKEYLIESINPIEEKIFVIDDGCQSIMMLAIEY